MTQRPRPSVETTLTRTDYGDDRHTLTFEVSQPPAADGLVVALVLSGAAVPTDVDGRVIDGRGRAATVITNHDDEDGCDGAGLDGGAARTLDWDAGYTQSNLTRNASTPDDIAATTTTTPEEGSLEETLAGLDLVAEHESAVALWRLEPPLPDRPTTVVIDIDDPGPELVRRGTDS